MSSIFRSTARKSAPYGLLFLAMGAGLAVRLWTLHDKALSINEISYWLPSIEARGLRDLIDNQLSVTYNHSPGYLIIPYLMNRLSSSLSAMRLTSLVIGLISIPVTFLFIRRFFRERIALIVTLLLAVSPFHSYYSVDLSPYALFYLLVILTLMALSMGLKTGRTVYFALVVPLNIACLAVHYSALAVVAVQALAGLFFIILQRKGLDRKVLLLKHLNALVAFFVLSLPWYGRFVETLGFTRTSFPIDSPAHFAPSYIVHAPVELFRLLGGIPMQARFFGVLLAALFFAGCFRAIKTKEAGPMLFSLFVLFSPLVEVAKVLPILMSSGGYLLILRLFLYLFPLVWGVSLWFIYDLSERGSFRSYSKISPVRFIVIGSFTVLSLWSILIINSDYSEKEIRKCFDYMLSETDDGDALVITPHFMIDVMSYYLPGSFRQERKPRTQWRMVPSTMREADAAIPASRESVSEQSEKYLAVVDLPGLGGTLAGNRWSMFSSRAWQLQFKQSILGKETFASPAYLELEMDLDRRLILERKDDFRGVEVRKYRIRRESIEWDGGKLAVNCSPFSELARFSPYFSGGCTGGNILNKGEYRFKVPVPEGAGEVDVSIITIEPLTRAESLEKVQVTVNGKSVPLEMVIREPEMVCERFRSIDPLPVLDGEVEILLRLDDLSLDGRGIRMIVFEIPRRSEKPDEFRLQPGSQP